MYADKKRRKKHHIHVDMGSCSCSSAVAVLWEGFKGFLHIGVPAHRCSVVPLAAVKSLGGWLVFPNYQLDRVLKQEIACWRVIVYTTNPWRSAKHKACQTQAFWNVVICINGIQVASCTDLSTLSRQEPKIPSAVCHLPSAIIIAKDICSSTIRLSEPFPIFPVPLTFRPAQRHAQSIVQRCSATGWSPRTITHMETLPIELPR